MNKALLLMQTPNCRAKKMFTPYFREWVNMRHQKGKSFISPPKLFKADRALYFPNLHGRTLVSKESADTTPVLEGKVSVISIYSGTWAERQTTSFVGEAQNKELHSVIVKGGAGIQSVVVNVEENPIRAWLLRLFLPNLRWKVPKEAHPRYFLVRRGITDGLRDAIGLLNSKVGYVYLVDGECKIRWAGSGVALPEEKEALASGARRLLDEWRNRRAAPTKQHAKEGSKIKIMAAA